eukprot:GHVU01131931.1.p3 GENE.GHVU01131931.1~~GHVU01131931.1.p3  ORF type:complete len:122 (-),score=13.12 GHVU01131931.1:916-1281(-)
MISDKGSQMIKAYRPLGLVNCVDHILKNVVDKLCEADPFKAAFRHAKAFVSHVLGRIIFQNTFGTLQKLLLAYSTAPQRFGLTRWLAWAMLAYVVVDNKTPIVAFVVEPLSAGRTMAEGHS